MSKTARYCRPGWKPVTLDIAAEDKDAATVDLARDGEIVVTGVAVIAADTPNEDRPEGSYAILSGGTSAAKSAPTKRATAKVAKPAASSADD